MIDGTAEADVSAALFQTVMVKSAPSVSPPSFSHGWAINQSDEWMSMFEQADKGAEERVPHDKTLGPIDRIENPYVIGVRHAPVFLTDDAMTGIFFPDAAT
jgi:hypothetical protein